MYQNNLDAQAIIAGDRQCRLRAGNDTSRLARSARGSRRHRVARPTQAQPWMLRHCVSEVLS